MRRHHTESADWGWCALVTMVLLGIVVTIARWCAP
jgi:hypothetical protein